MFEKPTVDRDEPDPGRLRARDAEGRNWFRIGAVAPWADIFRIVRRERLRRWMINEGVSEAAIERILAKHVPQKRMKE